MDEGQPGCVFLYATYTDTFDETWSLAQPSNDCSNGQLNSNYKTRDLISKQIAAVINFPAKQIGNIMSEVLVVGFPDNNDEPILISPDKIVKNGGKLY